MKKNKRYKKIMNFLEKNRNFLVFLGFCLILLSWVASKTIVEKGNIPSLIDLMPQSQTEETQQEKKESVVQPEKLGFKKFLSIEEFKSYLQKSESLGQGGGIRVETAMVTPNAVPAAKEAPLGTGASAPDLAYSQRVSQTNVQVTGIDEPDIIKTDGKKIYFSPGYVYGGPIIFRAEPATKIMRAPDEGKTSIINALPLESVSLNGIIEKSGEMILSDKKLVIFAGDGLYAYDISDPKKPEKKWDIKYENSWLVAARLYNGKIYLVTRSSINMIQPCPVEPFSLNGQKFSVSCGEIYHPEKNVVVDTTFIASVINLETGMIDDKIPFIGSAEESVVYMSEKNLYLAYSYHEDAVKFFLNFFKEKAPDIVPVAIVAKMEKLSGYDISYQAKTVELQNIWENFLGTLGKDERLKAENDLNNRFADYYKSHLREMESTGIVRIALDGFKIQAQGSVPGSPLNQWCLDEYEGNLRVAATLGERWWGLWLSGLNMPTSNSANDVYVLDGSLKTIGSLTNLGLQERIYSARFIADKGYVVTFRQTDPFYVIDLKDPKNPKLAGELKIPGYSGYLHPISKDKILGIGQENWQVKLAIFDVSDPQNPKELDKYLLKEGYSDALNNHRAFLLDQKHQVFFLPAQGAYVFSYKDDKLQLTKALSLDQARRAVYINDYLYVFSNNSLVVLDENNWEKVKSLDLR